MWLHMCVDMYIDICTEMCTGLRTDGACDAWARGLPELLPVAHSYGLYGHGPWPFRTAACGTLLVMAYMVMARGLPELLPVA